MEEYGTVWNLRTTSRDSKTQDFFCCSSVQLLRCIQLNPDFNRFRVQSIHVHTTSSLNPALKPSFCRLLQSRLRRVQHQRLKPCFWPNWTVWWENWNCCLPTCLPPRLDSQHKMKPENLNFVGFGKLRTTLTCPNLASPWHVAHWPDCHMALFLAKAY